MALLHEEAEVNRTIAEICKEVVSDFLDEKKSRHDLAVIKWGIHRDYCRFAEQRGMNPYLCVNVYECLADPDESPILMFRKKKRNTIDNEQTF